MVRNRLKQIRHQLEIDTQKEFAEFLGITRSQISLWESQTQQPSIDRSISLWLQLHTRLPDINLQDLFEWENK